jgi:two-component system response regulator HydG
LWVKTVLTNWCPLYPTHLTIIGSGLIGQTSTSHLIGATLRQTDNNRTRAAEILGITRQTLQNKLKEYGLT